MAKNNGPVTHHTLDIKHVAVSPNIKVDLGAMGNQVCKLLAVELPAGNTVMLLWTGDGFHNVYPADASFADLGIELPEPPGEVEPE